MTHTTLLVVNGPGLADQCDVENGAHEQLTLGQIQGGCKALCDELGVDLDFRQTDDAKEMDRWISDDSQNFDALIINPIACSSAATADFKMSRSAIKALANLKTPLIEVHIENFFRDSGDSIEPFHEPDYESALICGLGIHGYLLAIRAIVQELQARSP